MSDFPKAREDRDLLTQGNPIAGGDLNDGNPALTGRGANRAPWQTPELEELQISSAASALNIGQDAAGHTDTSNS